MFGGGFHGGIPNVAGNVPGSNVWGRRSRHHHQDVSAGADRHVPGLGDIAADTANAADGAPRSASSPISGSVFRHPLARLRHLVVRPGEPGSVGGSAERAEHAARYKVDLSDFHAKGGKLLLAHGTSDVLVSTRATKEYYQQLQS